MDKIKIKNYVEDDIDKMGYVLVDVELKKNNGLNNLTFILDKPQGINIEDCEKVHRFLDTKLDELDVSNGLPYTLNVSSYGLDRSLVLDYDFNKFKNELIELTFYSNYQKNKKIQCKLINHTIDNLEVEYNNKIQKIDRKIIACVKPVIKF